jgi:hypothetical protein
LTVVADGEPARRRGQRQPRLFEESGVVVVAPDGDPAARLLGASAAVGLGVPLLLDPEGEAGDDAVAGELDRLGATSVLAVGGGGAPGDADVVTVPATAEAVAAATGLDLADADPVPATARPPPSPPSTPTRPRR